MTKNIYKNLRSDYHVTRERLSRLTMISIDNAYLDKLKYDDLIEVFT